jgi:hypothetical protein
MSTPGQRTRLTGQTYGPRGDLHMAGPRKIVCGLCGNTFQRLGNHTLWAHGITAAEYKESFHLKQSVGLVSESERAAMQQRTANTFLTASARARLRRHAESTLAKHCAVCAKPFLTPRFRNYATCSPACKETLRRSHRSYASLSEDTFRETMRHVGRERARRNPSQMQAMSAKRWSLQESTHE